MWNGLLLFRGLQWHFQNIIFTIWFRIYYIKSCCHKLNACIESKIVFLWMLNLLTQIFNNFLLLYKLLCYHFLQFLQSTILPITIWLGISKLYLLYSDICNEVRFRSIQPEIISRYLYYEKNILPVRNGPSFSLHPVRWVDPHFANNTLRLVTVSLYFRAKSGKSSLLNCPSLDVLVLFSP